MTYFQKSRRRRAAIVPASVGAGETPVKDRPSSLSPLGRGQGEGAPTQAGTTSAAAGRSGQPGPRAAFFFSMMSPAYFSR